MVPRVLVLRGTPLEVGRQHGESLRHEIRDLQRSHEVHLIDLTASRGAVRVTREQITADSHRYLEVARAWAPHLVEELEGIAQGADMAVTDVVALNAFLEWYDWTFPRKAAQGSPAGCTAMAVGPDHADQGGLLAQNYDLVNVFPAGGVILDVQSNGTRALVATLPGMLGLAGLNEHGIGLVINKLVPRDAGIGMIYPLICRRVLEQIYLHQAVDQVIRPRRASGLHYLIMDRTGEFLGIETTGANFEVLNALDDVLVHTNHYLSPLLRPYEDAKKPYSPDTITRFRRMSRLVQKLPRPVGPETIKALLSDHHCSPCSICRHAETKGQESAPGHTVFSVVLEPSQRRFHFAPGSPCTNAYSQFEV